MKQSTRFLAVATAALLAVAAPAGAALPAVDSQGQPLPTLAPMIERTVPGVVNIFTRTRVPQRQHPLYSDPFFRHFFGMPEQAPERHGQSLGSGVVVDAENGYILTNNHVIERAVEIAVNLHDGRTLTAEVVGTDPDADIAVIRVAAENLQALPLAAPDTLSVGDFVVAIGNPFGLGQTVTSGIVSALGRSGLGIEGYEDFIQTDASINPGNSGGALVNLRGELVGINTAILSRSGGNHGIGFAIPIEMASKITAQLVEFGEVRRGVLGVQAQDLTPELASAFNIADRQGAVVTQVVPGSPAHRAGLEAGDVITAVNSRPVNNASDVRNRIGLLRVGESVTLTVRRDGRSKTVTAVVEEPRAATLQGEQLHRRLAGAVIGNLTEGMPLHGKVEGVVVLDLDPASPAARAGLRRGDVLVSVNRKPTPDVAALRQAASGANQLLINLQRGNGALFLVLR